MALSRQASTTSLLGGSRFGVKSAENEGIHMAKAKSVTTRTRATLGNLSNMGQMRPDATGRATKEAGFLKPTKPVPSVVTRAATNKENVSKQQEKTEVAVKPSSPMDVSSTALVVPKLPANVEDIDKDDGDNPQLVSEYVNEIYSYLRQLELELPLGQRYLDGTAINGRMRAILVDWLVQVHLRFHLLQETLYLTVGIIDRFLQEAEVSRSKLQLVGVTAMLIASKYEEMYAPEINDFVYITDNAYSKADICSMERVMLRTLGFNMGRPLPLHFLRRNSKAGGVDPNEHTLAKYLMELTIVDYDMVHVRPSEIAAAALCLSVKLLDVPATRWTDTLEHYAQYKEADLTSTMCKMASLVMKAGTGKLTTIKTKYSSSKFMRIALLPNLKSSKITELAAKAKQ